MNQPQKHKDVIVAWANGEEIEYRVKPEPKESVHTFRIGVAAGSEGSVYTITADNEEEEQHLQADPNFIGWITEWVPFLLIKVEE